MDKSDSELLADWDVVSFVYDTEQRTGVTENIADTHIGRSTRIDVNANDDTEDADDTSVKSSEVDSQETTDVHNETPVGCDTKQDVDDIVSEEISDIDTVAEQPIETVVVSEHLVSIDTIEESTKVGDMEYMSDVAEETKASDIRGQISEDDDVEEQIIAVGTVSAEITTGEAQTGNNECTNQELEENIASESQEVTDENISDPETKNNYASDEENKETVPDHKPDASVEYSSVDKNSDDHVVNSSLDSSMEHIQIEHCGGSFVQDVPELTPDLIEQENAAIESSSSDIDIIDENMEESITSSFVHPISLSISSSVDTSSILTTPSEGDKEVQTEIRTDVSTFEKTESYVEKSPSYSQTYESYSKTSEAFSGRSEHFQRSTYEEENVRPEPRRPRPQNATCGIVAGIMEFIRNMTRFEWSILGGVMLCLYITIVFNQTNIFAVVEKEDVVLQMKKMIDELKLDNKILKDQMLSEMKNEKVFSTFEHQIKELKKENSKLNHMLYDVAKVLEEQKDTQKRFEKRAADYAAPFKNEINKLKEHINMLKFDNEELQKQLVRMRYASYSQGGRDTSDDNAKARKGETDEETASTDEIALDLNSLKKWNELISLLSKELGLSENEQPFAGDKSETKNIKWYWKVFLQEFKGTFKDFKANVTSVISDYKKANEKAVSEIYKYVKDFFTVKEDNNQKYVPPGEESSQWKNIGDFVKDLSDKWVKIKDRIYTSDIKEFVKSFKKSGESDNSHNDYSSEKRRSPVYDYEEQKPTNVHFESDRKYNKPTEQSKSEEWMFKRAELRAELRDSEKEDDSVNWYLKRKKRTSVHEDVKF